jgi:O-antigen ligase
MIAKQQFELPTFVPMIIFLVLLSGIIQCIWGSLQYFGIVSLYAGIFRIVGSFQNPGVYANYLACIFPMALAVLLYSERKAKKVLFVTSLFFILCCIFVMPLTMARTAWLGMLVGTFVVLQYRFGWFVSTITRLKKRILIFVIVVLLIFIGMACYFIYHIKPESAQGRMLIYKIAMEICKKRPMFGTGFNTFAKEYNFYQSDYFASGAGDETEKWLADNVQVAFNEYLQVVVETGFVGLMLMLSIGGILIVYRTRIRTSNAIGALGGVASIACCACFSYPFREISIIVLAGWMLLIVENDIKPLSISVTATCQKTIAILFMLITIFLCYYSITTILSVSRWKNLTAQTSIYGFDNNREKYKDLYTKLNKDPYFLYNYGVELILAKDYKQGILVLQQTSLYLSNTEIFCYLGDAYKGIRLYKKAEKNYLFASNMVPNKFYPLYCLANLYYETGNATKAYEIAIKLVNKKEKVQSYTTYRIKSEMKQLIDTLSVIKSSQIKSHNL